MVSLNDMLELLEIKSKKLSCTIMFLAKNMTSKDYFKTRQ